MHPGGFTAWLKINIAPRTLYLCLTWMSACRWGPQEAWRWHRLSSPHPAGLYPTHLQGLQPILRRNHRFIANIRARSWGRAKANSRHHSSPCLAGPPLCTLGIRLQEHTLVGRGKRKKKKKHPGSVQKQAGAQQGWGMSGSENTLPFLGELQQHWHSHRQRAAPLTFSAGQHNR